MKEGGGQRSIYKMFKTKRGVAKLLLLSVL